jgi:hypothetical protein
MGSDLEGAVGGCGGRRQRTFGPRSLDSKHARAGERPNGRRQKQPLVGVVPPALSCDLRFALRRRILRRLRGLVGFLHEVRRISAACVPGGNRSRPPRPDLARCMTTAAKRMNRPLRFDGEPLGTSPVNGHRSCCPGARGSATRGLACSFEGAGKATGCGLRTKSSASSSRRSDSRAT